MFKNLLKKGTELLGGAGAGNIIKKGANLLGVDLPFKKGGKLKYKKGGKVRNAFTEQYD